MVNDPAIERLAILAEEMGEALHIIGKILRHGPTSYDPTVERPDTRNVLNMDILTRELGDVLLAIEMLRAAGDICDPRISIPYKCGSLVQWLHCPENMDIVRKIQGSWRAHGV